MNIDETTESDKTAKRMSFIFKYSDKKMDNAVAKFNGVKIAGLNYERNESYTYFLNDRKLNCTIK